MNIGIWKSKKLAASFLLASLLLSAVALAHHRTWKWWKRGPIPAVEDVTFTQVSARDGRVRNIRVVDGQIRLRSKLVLNETNIAATVLAGVISIAPISQSRGVVNVDIVLDPATLQRNIFNSTFTGEGTAAVTTADANVIVPVTYFGTITQHAGQYRLKAEIRGLAGIDATSASIVKVKLLAVADIPTP
jgi:hypothetical protein